MRFKTSFPKALMVLFSGTFLTTTAFAESIPANTKVMISGTIIGPITTGQVEDGSQIKSFHLKMKSTMEINDPKSTCGSQDLKQIPIHVEGMGKFKNKNVRLNASINCIESKLGSYAIDHVYSAEVIK